MLKMVLRLLLAVLVVQPAAPQAFAQSTRTWVSGTGDDGNPCSRTSPCKTFAGAISKTAAGGWKSMRSTRVGSAVSPSPRRSRFGLSAWKRGVLVAGVNGITISAAATDQVVLEGLDIEGLASGLDGISIMQAGEVVIKDCNIHKFTGNGVTIMTNGQVRVTIDHSSILENLGSGVVVNSAAGFGHAKIFNSLILSNGGDGVQVNGSGNDALLSGDQILGSVRSINTTTGVAGGTIRSYGNNVLTAGDAPSAVPLS